jgi:hypothetical protein
MKLNILPARAGAQWVRLGLRTFFRQPLALGSLFTLSLLVVALVAQVPVAGSVVALALMPAFTVGLMAAAREADSGKIPLPAILFIAFRQGAARARAMIVLGLLYAAAIMVTIGIAALIDGGNPTSLPAGQTQITSLEQLNALMSNPRASLAMWVSLVLYALVSAVFWHAPALTHWYGIPPVKSLFFSAVAVRRNVRPFLQYGLLWLCLAFGAGLVLIVLALLTGSLTASVVVALPISLLLQAMLFTSVWFTFRDSFAADEPPLPTSPLVP